MRAILYAALLLAGAQPAAASQALDAALAQRLSQSPRTPGLAYAVVEKDGSISQGSVGLSNIETGAPVQSEMLFRPGSTTKMMVAAALLQVMHARKMSRRTTVGMIAPQAHASLRQLTVHQLLSMTAPLTNGEKDNGPLDDAALAERVKSGADLTVFDKRDTIFPIRMALTIWPDIFSSYWSASHFQTR